MGLFSKMKDAQRQGMFDPAVHASLAGDAAKLNAGGQEMRRLWAEGIDGTAVIQSARDTGERLAGNTVLDLDLLVTTLGGEPYRTTLRMPIAGSDTSPYVPGKQYDVKVDAADRSKLVFSA
jgi:hypothetical protein